MAKYGFIGCGNMGGALARALSGTCSDILLANRSPEKAEALARELGVSVASNEEVAQSCDYIYLGVKPQALPEVLSTLADIFAAREVPPILITMAAGVKMSRVAALAGGEYPIIRIMPNTPVTIGKGMVLYCANALVSSANLHEFCNDLRNAGILDELSENLMNAGCSISGCGPAFMYQFIEALQRGASSLGIPAEKALLYTAATMEGAAAMALASSESPEQLKKNVCSPGGATLEGVAVFDDAALNDIATKALLAAYNRTCELAGE